MFGVTERRNEPGEVSPRNEYPRHRCRFFTTKRQHPLRKAFTRMHSQVVNIHKNLGYFVNHASIARHVEARGPSVLTQTKAAADQGGLGWVADGTAELCCF